MVKIALCLSGYLRTHDKTHINLNRNIIGTNQCDVFCHSWSYTNSDRKYPTDEKYVRSLYNPVSLEIENSDNLNYFWKEANRDAPWLRDVRPKHPSHMYSMFYSIFKANELKSEYENTHKFKYDLVIRARYDHIFTHQVLFNQFDVKDTIYFSHLHNYNGIGDQFAFSNTVYMDVYSSLYYSLARYFSQSVHYYPEVIVKWYIEQQKLNYKFVDIDYHIQR